MYNAYESIFIKLVCMHNKIIIYLFVDKIDSNNRSACVEEIINIQIFFKNQ